MMTPMTTVESDAHERNRPTAELPALACQWTVDSEGQAIARWHEVRAMPAENLRRLDMAPMGGPQDDLEDRFGGATKIGRLAASALLVISVLGTVICFTTEPSGLV
jgi:hypothetical protein